VPPRERAFRFTGGEFFRYDVDERPHGRPARAQHPPVIDASSAALKGVIAEGRRLER